MKTALYRHRGNSSSCPAAACSLLVRVIEYTVNTTLDEGGDEETSELFCLVTDLLDP